MLKRQVNYAIGELPYALAMGTTGEQAQTMGDRIRTLRESRKLTQDDLGKIIGITGVSISQWESGATKGIKPENFLRFCDYFGVDPYWVVFGPDGDPQKVVSLRSKQSA